MLQCWRHVT